MSDGFIIRSPLRSSTFCAAIQSTGRHEAEWTLGTRPCHFKKVIIAIIVMMMELFRWYLSCAFNRSDLLCTIMIIGRPDLARKFVPLLGEENSIKVHHHFNCHNHNHHHHRHHHHNLLRWTTTCTTVMLTEQKENLPSGVFLGDSSKYHHYHHWAQVFLGESSKYHRFHHLWPTGHFCTLAMFSASV